MKQRPPSDEELALLLHKAGFAVPEADRAQVFQAMRDLKRLAEKLAAWNKN
jgi:hypothetical protein